MVERVLADDDRRAHVADANPRILLLPGGEERTPAGPTGIGRGPGRGRSRSSDPLAHVPTRFRPDARESAEQQERTHDRPREADTGTAGVG
ncbi:hypothetical protein AB0I91_21245 [Actinosynnema sp. NPDC049800]